MERFDLSYDPRDPPYPVPGIEGARWSAQIFTTDNVYGLDPDRTTVTERGDGIDVEASGLSSAGQQQRAPGGLTAEVLVVDGVTTWHLRARHDEPIKAVKLVLRDLPAEATVGGWWHMATWRGLEEHPQPLQPVTWHYPWPELVTPWAAVGGAGRHVCVAVRDEDLRAKRFHAALPPWAGGVPVVEVVCDQDATRRGGDFVVPEVRVRVCADPDEARLDALDHLDWVERTYGIPRWEVRTDVPDWFHSIAMVVNLHGQHWTGYVFNTFDEMADALRFVTRSVPGERLLAYLPGWEGRYYHDYPWYRPSPALGGDDGFRRLLDVARRMGVRCMPMFGMHGVNATQYPDWERSAVRTTTNRMPALVNRPDWDGDRAPEDDQVFCNPGEPTFRRHLLEQVSAAVDEFGVDGVFLDTSGCWFNDPVHPLLDGYRLLVSELRERHPRLLIAGEGWCDAMLPLFPVNQSWFGVDPDYRVPEVLTRYGRALGHLSTGAPGRGSTGVHEAGYLLPSSGRAVGGHLPTLSIVDDTLSRHADEVAVFCERVIRDR